jgi:hypothetical protein
MVNDMRTRCLPILLLASLALASCDNDESARTVDPPAPTTDEMIIADCFVVRDALEAYATQNGGYYPDGWHRNDFIPFLPGGVPLTNHYTGLATGPVLQDPQWPGEIGVILYAEVYQQSTGYRVVGRGRSGELIRLENLSSLSQHAIDAVDSLLANCDAVVAAVEAFANQGGSYPADVGSDALPNGDVLSDLLPNGGQLLTNPFHGWRDTPVDGDPTGTSGLVGYTPGDMYGNGVRESYLIEAVGGDAITKIALRTRQSPEDEVVRGAALILKAAAEAFASQNAGEYPHDISIDETPAGNTLLEIVSCSWCTNPYTGASSFRDGLATSRGEVGYVPLEYNGIVTGYVINALGLFNVELERFEVLTN